MSTLRTTTIATLDGSASVPTNTVVNGTAKAWVNFNGTGTVAIRTGFNVSSITDNGIGDYTVNFANAMPDTSYAVSGGSQTDYAANDNNAMYVGVYRSSGAMATTGVRVVTRLGNNTTADGIAIGVVVFR